MRKVLAALVGWLLFVPALPAGAGGALLDFDRHFYVPGDVVHAASSVWLESARGRLEDGPYFAYVSDYSGLDSMPLRVPPDALRVARAEVVPDAKGEHGNVYVEFVLPEIEPGRHWLTICNDPCRVQLGDVLPTVMTVASDDEDGRLRVLEAELSQEIENVERELESLVLGRRPDAIRPRLTAVERDVRRLAGQVNHLAAEVGSAEPSPREDESSALSPLLAFVLPAAAAGVFFGRRSRRG